MIIDPTTDKTWTLGEVTKKQLAEMVNDQSRTIKAMEASLMRVTHLWLTVLAEPDSLQAHAVNELRIEKGAFDRVVRGSRLKIYETATHMVVTASLPGESGDELIHTPTLLLPKA